MNVCPASQPAVSIMPESHGCKFHPFKKSCIGILQRGGFHTLLKTAAAIRVDLVAVHRFLDALGQVPRMVISTGNRSTEP